MDRFETDQHCRLLGAAESATDIDAGGPGQQRRLSRVEGSQLERVTDGRVFTGCNVENATYGLTVCPERVALFKAISEGARRFVGIAVVADTAAPTPPCGACRQLLWEFGGDLEVILGNLTTETGRYRLKDLFPLPFDRTFLQES